MTCGATALAADTPEAAGSAKTQTDPLVRLLAAKGVLTASEAEVLGALPASQQRDQLTLLLLKKGVISTSDLKGNTDSNVWSALWATLR